MTVADLIQWLSTQDQSAKMVIHDADTEWFLDLKTDTPYAPWNKVPTGCVSVHGEYYDQHKED